MAQNRSELQELLEEIMGGESVYFQPPENTKISYPCIVYALDYGVTKFADNSPYRFSKRYQLILITLDPDDPAFEKLVTLPACTYQRHYISDNLHHYSFNLFF